MQNGRVPEQESTNFGVLIPETRAIKIFTKGKKYNARVFAHNLALNSGDLRHVT